MLRVEAPPLVLYNLNGGLCEYKQTYEQFIPWDNIECSEEMTHCYTLVNSVGSVGGCTGKPFS